MPYRQDEVKDWLNLPITKTFLECIAAEAEVGRQSLYNGALSGTAEEVGTDYLSVINKVEALEALTDAAELLDAHYQIQEDDDE